MSNLYVSLEEKIQEILIPAFWATVMIALMESKCTDWVIKIRDDAIGEIENLFLSQIKVIDDMIEEVKKQFPDNKKYIQFWEWLITGKLDSLRTQTTPIN